MTTPQPAIETHGLTKRYPRLTALSDCSITVPPGRICALVGPNGAGKTTLLRMLASLARPTAGTAAVLGGAPRQDPAFLAQIGYLAQEIPLYRRLSAEDHIRAGAHLNPRHCGWAGVGVPCGPHQSNTAIFLLLSMSALGYGPNLAFLLLSGYVIRRAVITKDFSTYKRIFLRQDKSLRDHEAKRVVHVAHVAIGRFWECRRPGRSLVAEGPRGPCGPRGERAVPGAPAAGAVPGRGRSARSMWPAWRKSGSGVAGGRDSPGSAGGAGPRAVGAAAE